MSGLRVDSQRLNLRWPDNARREESHGPGHRVDRPRGRRSYTRAGAVGGAAGHGQFGKTGSGARASGRLATVQRRLAWIKAGGAAALATSGHGLKVPGHVEIARDGRAGDEKVRQQAVVVSQAPGRGRRQEGSSAQIPAKIGSQSDN